MSIPAILTALALFAVAILAIGWWAFRGLPRGDDYYREIDRRHDGRKDADTTARK